jgi:hypothetical protein
VSVQIFQGESKVVKVHELPTYKKRIRKISEQGENESRRLWYNVTQALKIGDIDAATEYKQRVSSLCVFVYVRGHVCFF